MKNLYLIFALLSITANAQNEEDVLRYSSESLGGTARNMGMAGAMSALGGDFSVVTQNPAALGRFNKNNFSFTSFIERNGTTTNYQGNTNKTGITNLRLGNISLLKSYQLAPKQSKDWVSVQMGAGFNRTQSFNQSFSYSGDSETSIIDYFISEADGVSENNLTSVYGYSSGLAYLTYAIDPTINDDNTTSYTSGKSGESTQSRSVSMEGGMGEFNFAMSGNFRNKLLIGGSFNVATLQYYTRFDHKEVFNDETSLIHQIDYNGYIDTRGTGINLRVGAIFMPSDFFRIGAAIETPTRYSMRESYGNDMITHDYLGTNTLTNDPAAPTGSFDYIIRSPLKTNFSAGFVFKKLASISVELEMVDYGSSQIKSTRRNQNLYSFKTENDQIKNLYTTSYNLKFGGEVRVTPNVYLRGGYAQFQSAYKPEKQIFDPSVEFYTGGIGYNFGSVYLDFATVFRKSYSNYHAYHPDMEGSTARVEQLKSQYVLTFGYRF